MVGFKREFAVRTIGMLATRLTLQLNFEAHLVRIVRGDSSDDSGLREQFEISSVVYLDKHSKTPPIVSIVAHVHPSAAKYSCKTVKESFCFDTPYEKDEFCRLLHVAIMLGHASFKAFQRLADDRCLLDPYELPPPLLRMIVGEEADKESKNEVLYDYCEYLVLLGEAFQSLTEKHALMPTPISDALGHPTLQLIPGEEAITRMNLAYLDPCDSFRALGIIRGVFYLTTHRLAIQVYNPTLRSKFDFISPLAHIDRALVNFVANSLRVVLLDNRVLEIGFDSPSTWIQTAADKINRSVAILRRDPRKSFLPKASKHSPNPEGWNLYSPAAEFARLGLDGQDWRLVNATSFEDENGAHVFAVPQMVADQQLRQVKAYREFQRVPAVVWRHPRTSAVLVRGAQPSASATRTENDEGLLTTIRLLNPNTDTLLVAAMGKRCEDYAKCVKICRNTEDMPGLRLSYERLTQICADRADVFSSTAPTPHLEHTYEGEEAGMALVFGVLHQICASEDSKQTSWNTALDQTKWLEHVKALLRDATLVAAMLDAQGASVFVHGSTGVDRESAVVSLAELLLDPFYRSIKGFIILIEKEWLNAGHPFPKRTGLGESGPDERIPIFVLWMDAVWQLTVQFPAMFEFTGEFLVGILEATQTDYYGTFMNSGDDPKMLSFLKTTLSAWPPLLGQAGFVNPFYAQLVEAKATELPDNLNSSQLLRSTKLEAEQAASTTIHVASAQPRTMLYPNVAPYSILFWDRYFFRWQAKPSPFAQLVELQRQWSAATQAKWEAVDRARKMEFEREKEGREAVLAHEAKARDEKFKIEEARRRGELEESLAAERERLRQAEELASFTRIQTEQLKFLQQARDREQEIAKEEAERRERHRREDAARKVEMDKEYEEFLVFKEAKEKEEAERLAREERAQIEQERKLEQDKLEEEQMEAAKAESSLKRSDSQLDPVQSNKHRHRFWVSIPTFTTSAVVDGAKPHTTYQIVVREFYEQSNYLEWTIEKRYSEFADLHEKLKSEFTKLPVPAMAPKQGMLKSSKSEAFLHSRRVALEAFLLKLVTSQIFQVDALHSFLQIGSPDRAITIGSEHE